MGYASSISQVLVVSPLLEDRSGHEFEYNCRILEAAQRTGLRTALAVPLSARLPEISTRILRVLISPPMRQTSTGLLPKARSMVSRIHRASGYRTLFSGEDDGQTLFVLHTTTYDELDLILSVRGSSPLAVLLRYDHYDEPERLRRIESIFRRHDLRRCSFFSDSYELATLLSPIVGSQVHVQPIPLAARPLAQQRHRSVGYFGAMRPVKGFDVLPDIVEAIGHLDSSIEFIVQAYRHPHDQYIVEMERAREALASVRSVRLIEQVLDEDEYSTLLDTCAVAVLPYDRNHYRAGTSGIFASIIASGGAALTTSHTWMASEARRYNLTRAKFITNWKAPREVAEIVVKLVDIGQSKFSPNAKEALFQTFHTSENYINQLIGVCAAN